MRKAWRGGRSHVTNQIVADSGSYTTKLWHGRAWVHLQRLYDEEITLYMPHGEVKALLAERTRTTVGTARPGLELRGLATGPPSTESEVPATVSNSAV